jgi:hypothetical protein
MSATVPFALRLDAEVDAEVRRLAAANGTSVNQAINDLLRRSIGAAAADAVARARLDDPEWLSQAAAAIRERDAGILDLLSR